jgi:hypothetical protein
MGGTFIYEMQNLNRKHEEKMSPRRPRIRQNDSIKIDLGNAVFDDFDSI